MGNLTTYIQEAMRRAKYSLIEDKEAPFLGEIPGLQGVFAVSNTLEGCRDELQSVLEGWITLALRRGIEIPALGKVRLENARSTSRQSA
jgi:predicted RNase H-like HicB family nuclease